MHILGTLASGLPYIFNACLVFSVVLITLLCLEYWISGTSVLSTLKNIGFRKTSGQILFSAILISVALLAVYPLFGYFFHTRIELMQNWQWNAIGLALTGGLTEEMLFRGFLFGKLRRQLSFRRAVLISTLVFSMAHLLLFTYMSWPIALFSTILAIGLSFPFAYMFEQGGNALWAPALVHTVIRTIGMVFTTDEKHYMTLTMVWISACLLVPNFILLLSKRYRNSFFAPDKLRV